jgi:hypothetical protein
VNVTSSVVRKFVSKGDAEKQLTGAPQKKCKGFPVCRESLSAKSHFEYCAPCRRHDKKWGADDMEISHVEKYYHRAEVQVYRLAKHLPRRLATVRKRA